MWLMERRKLGGDGSDFFHPHSNKLGDEISTADGCPQEFYATSLNLLDAAANRIFDTWGEWGRRLDCGLFGLEVKSPERTVPEKDIHHLLQLLC